MTDHHDTVYELEGKLIAALSEQAQLAYDIRETLADIADACARLGMTSMAEELTRIGDEVFASSRQVQATYNRVGNARAGTAWSEVSDTLKTLLTTPSN